ncbi:MAG: MFS transporter [Planctomycetes bacterium]|nr:MFS transporter [Planctomycetota bacterium]
MSLVPRSDKLLFWGCFIALITTAFGFILRVFLMDGWAKEFNFSATQKGELLGVGLWPFAISIVIFSLIIDRIGYKTAMFFGFACHMISLVMTVSAKSYEELYWANFVVALGNGTVEAYINPVVATQFKHDKSRWLNILHAGWPGGLVLAGLLALSLPVDMAWQTKMWLLAIPAVLYVVILAFQSFPVNERVAAGGLYRDMLKEVGAAGTFIIVWLMAVELVRSTTSNPDPMMVGSVIAAGSAIAMFAYTRSLGRPLFLLLLLIMVPLATTELGVDSWVSDLMKPILGANGPYVLLYTSALMMILRFCAGPILHKLSPIGVLAGCSLLAALGLVALSHASNTPLIFGAATLYAVGKSFFWPTMLGVVTEQCPKGGALALNATGGVGMLGVGVIGAMLLGFMQDTTLDSTVKAKDAAVHEKVMVEKTGLLGSYKAVDEEKLKTATAEEQKVIADAKAGVQQDTLQKVALFPIAMLAVYLGLLLYYRGRGGYRPVDVATAH